MPACNCSSYGSVDLAFAYLGADGSVEPSAGSHHRRDLPPGARDRRFGHRAGAHEPRRCPRGLRGRRMSGSTRPGSGASRSRPTSPGMGPLTPGGQLRGERTSTSLPAPGDRALRSENLTLDFQGRRTGARSTPAPRTTNRCPTPSCIGGRSPTRSPSTGRRWCLFSTPVYCLSQFCGPDAEALAQLAKDYPDRAVFIHIEIWNLYTQDEKIANEARRRLALPRRRPHRALALPDRCRREDRGPLGPVVRRRRGRQVSSRPCRRWRTVGSADGRTTAHPAAAADDRGVLPPPRRPDRRALHHDAAAPSAPNA